MENNEILKDNYKYYLNHHEEIVEKYLNKFIVIKGQKIVDSYDTFEEAVNKSSEKYELGTYLIQKCTKTIDEDTQIFHSRVVY